MDEPNQSIRRRRTVESYEMLQPHASQIYLSDNASDMTPNQLESRSTSPSAAKSSKSASRSSLIDALKRKTNLHPATRSWLSTVIIQTLVALWLVPIAVLLWLNFSSYRIGPILWCPQGPCSFNPFDVSSVKTAQDSEGDARNLVGVLQLVAKALEGWFIGIASGFLYALTSYLVLRRTGLPLSLFMAYVEFSDFRILISGEFWKSIKPLSTGTGRKRAALNWTNFSFLILVAMLCIVANLMGPAVAVLCVPRLQDMSTKTYPLRLFQTLKSDTPPRGSLWASYECTEELLDDKNYTCTKMAHAPVFDAWSTASTVFRDQDGTASTAVQDSTDPIIHNATIKASLLAVSQEEKVSFTFNQTGGSEFWAPSRQMLRAISKDFEHYHNEVNNGKSLQPLFGPIPYMAESMTDLDTSKESDEYFQELSNSLETVLKRRGPALGAQINFVHYDKFEWIDAKDSDRSILCMYGWNPFSLPKSDLVKCLAINQADKTEAFHHWTAVETGDTNAPSSIGMHYASWAAFFRNSSSTEWITRHFAVGQHQPTHGQCNNATLPEGLRSSGSPFPLLCDNVHTIFFGMDQDGKQPEHALNFGIEFRPAFSFAEYALDVSPATNSLRLVTLDHMPERMSWSNSNDTVIHPSWLNALFSAHRNEDGNFITQSLRDSSSIFGDLEDLDVDNALPEPEVPKEMTEQLHLLSYAAYILPLHLMSMLPFESETLPDKIEDWQENRMLSRNGNIEVWAYGLETRTSKMGIVIVLCGCIITVAYFILSFWMRVKVRSPTSLVAAALVYPPAGDELIEAHEDGDKAGRIRFRSDFRDGGWIKFDKVL